MRSVASVRRRSGMFGNTDAARVRDTFKTSCNVYPVPRQIAVALLDHVAQMDANPELDTTLPVRLTTRP
jgi:hypothetical protein